MGQFNPDQFNNDQFNVDADEGTTTCDHVYAVRDDVEVIYGSANVTTWADINNNGVSGDVTRRISWALCLATSWLDDRLRGGPYVVPFEEPYANSLIDACARLAGVLLYESRGIVDSTAEGEPVHQLAHHRKMVEKFVASVHAGRIKPGAQPSARTYPAAIRDHHDSRHRHDRSLCDPPRLV